MIMNNKTISQITKIVESQSQKKENIFGPQVFKNHILEVAKIGKKLSLERHADSEIVEISALLHDYASLKNSSEIEKHHIFGIKYADQILNSLDYPEKRIEKVKHCIYAHRGSQNLKRESIEAECLADADAISHFYHLGDLFFVAYSVKNLSQEKGIKWVIDKLFRSYSKLSPYGKKYIEKEYHAIKLLFKNSA